MEKCTFCKGILKNSTATFTIDLDNSVVVIRNVPAMRCQQCGEVYYSTEVMEQLYNIANKVKNTLTEVAIITYSPAA